MRIFLIGYMGSGKSTVGKKLSDQLGYNFVDTDQRFEELYKISIPDFFAKYGEELFRKMERNILLELKDSEDIVISTGGGTSCYSDNMEHMKSSGLTIFLSMSVDNLATRLTFARKKRPLVTDLKGRKLVEYIENQLSNRLLYYCNADYTIDINDKKLETITLSILQYLKQLR